MRHLPDEFVQEIIDDLDQAAQRYASAKALAEGLKEDRKITKAQLMNVAAAEGVTVITAREQFAYSHATYLDVVHQLKAAIRDAARAEYDCKICELRFEAWRTINANQRVLTR